MANFGRMKTVIEREMKRGELSADAAAVSSAIIQSVGLWSQRRFHWNEFRDETHTTTADDPYLSITATLVITKLDSVRLTIANRDYPLIQADWSKIEALDSSQWSGFPELWTWYAKQIRLYPIPNDTYTVKLSGTRFLTEISANASNSATNAWMTDGEVIVRLTAKAFLWRDELRRPDMADYFFRESERIYREQHRTNTNLIGSGRVRTYYF